MKTYRPGLLFLLPMFLWLPGSAQTNTHTKKASTSTTKVKTTTQDSKVLFDRFFALSDGDSADLYQKSVLIHQIIKLDSLSKYTFYVASWAALASKQYEGLETKIQNIISSFPDFAEAYFLHGQCLNYTSQSGDVEEIQKCIEMNPKLSQPYFFLASIYEKDKKYKLALTYYNLLEQADANHKSIYYNRGTVRSALKDTVGAIEDFTKAINKQPGHFRAVFNRGLHYLIMENYTNAEADFTTFLKMKPDYGLAYYYRANAKFYQGNYRAACEDFKAAAKLGDQNAIAYLEKGCKE